MEDEGASAVVLHHLSCPTFFKRGVTFKPRFNDILLDSLALREILAVHVRTVANTSAPSRFHLVITL